MQKELELILDKFTGSKEDIAKVKSFDELNRKKFDEKVKVYEDYKKY